MDKQEDFNSKNVIKASVISDTYRRREDHRHDFSAKGRGGALLLEYSSSHVSNVSTPTRCGFSRSSNHRSRLLSMYSMMRCRASSSRMMCS